MSEVLKVENLEVCYGDVQVLWGISFDVKESEIVALLGANGAGKTTTLKTISGLLKPKSGRIFFMGKDVTELEPHKRVEMGLAHIPEGRQLFPRLTVYENLKAAAYTHRAREKFDETLELIYNLFPILRERRNQLAGTLSGGEQQMLAIARGLVLRPTLLMLDEPSLGLAPKLVIEVLDFVSKLKGEGYTVLLVEQNVHQALKLCDRAYIIETGRIVKHGTGHELLEDEEVKKAYLGI
ncbi:MAG: ABC transporter ATP-binding protein [Candidatus Methanomethylicota archaeon]|uniref:ABC transporter ATP-binding protein n=1 Tax=Thermoproteota archaeon TaxID=2056631 RepID=A0A497F932_9CREN|nr:MAG: ABC transporter ATP-binding protein [Candidatus Verstraetearchaeota archaeon]